MPFRMFHDFFPEIAERETRILTFKPIGDQPFPSNEYAFVELFCDEKGCDCRRVIFQVQARYGDPEPALITWGWEDEEFYRNWGHFKKTPDMIAELKGPALERSSPRTDTARFLLKALRSVLASDPIYVGQIKSHYKMFREKIDGAPGKDWWRKRKRLR